VYWIQFYNKKLANNIFFFVTTFPELHWFYKWLPSVSLFLCHNKNGERQENIMWNKKNNLILKNKYLNIIKTLFRQYSSISNIIWWRKSVSRHTIYFGFALEFIHGIDVYDYYFCLFVKNRRVFFLFIKHNELEILIIVW
jgi:hypothetical protein